MTIRRTYPRTGESPSFTAPVKMTKSNDAGDNLDVAGRSLLVNTPGTATLHFDDGTSATDYPLQEGYNPLGGVVRIATGGTADDIWVLF